MTLQDDKAVDNLWANSALDPFSSCMDAQALYIAECASAGLTQLETFSLLMIALSPEIGGFEHLRMTIHWRHLFG
ncbi:MULTISPECIES: hypothetical protein [Pseudomonas]|uniref:hypothetical protein n=1 Tax=Pseudomonas TaxID=286 RepID=UPI0011874B55|nr:MULTISPECIES: hypothetical protein [Pseudomonas]WIN06878.1 hypothetical protein QQF68_25450 [Pseudomonas syringae pv. antirrhini str. 126]